MHHTTQEGAANRVICIMSSTAALRASRRTASALSRVLSHPPSDPERQLEAWKIALTAATRQASSSAPFAASSVCRAAQGDHEACWKCEARVLPKSNLFCATCSVIQPARTEADYFELLGLPRRFDVNLRELEDAFRHLQRHLHPDKFTTKDELEREHSNDQASLVNVAYRTLRSPLGRANYLLKLLGGSPVDASEGTIDDPEVLMEIMEIREAVDEAGPAELKELRKRSAADLRRCEGAAREAFDKGDLRAARAATVQLTYFTKISEEIAEKERQQELGAS